MRAVRFAVLCALCAAFALLAHADQPAFPDGLTAAAATVDGGGRAANSDDWVKNLLGSVYGGGQAAAAPGQAPPAAAAAALDTGGEGQQSAPQAKEDPGEGEAGDATAAGNAAAAEPATQGAAKPSADEGGAPAMEAAIREPEAEAATAEAEAGGEAPVQAAEAPAEAPAEEERPPAEGPPGDDEAGPVEAPAEGERPSAEAAAPPAAVPAEEAGAAGPARGEGRRLFPNIPEMIKRILNGPAAQEAPQPPPPPAAATPAAPAGPHHVAVEHGALPLPAGVRERLAGAGRAWLAAPSGPGEGVALKRYRQLPAESDEAPVGVPSTAADHRVRLMDFDLVIREPYAADSQVRALETRMARDHYGLKYADVRPGDVVIDVGANTGWFTLAAAKMFPRATIVALEPVPLSFALLLHNLRVNGVSNVIALHMGVTSDGRDVPVRSLVPPDSVAGAHLGAVERVRTATLEDLFLSYVPDQLALLKVDCAGCEHELFAEPAALGRIRHIRGEQHSTSYYAPPGGPPPAAAPAPAVESRATRLMRCLGRALGAAAAGGEDRDFWCDAVKGPKSAERDAADKETRAAQRPALAIPPPLEGAREEGEGPVAAHRLPGYAVAESQIKAKEAEVERLQQKIASLESKLAAAKALAAGKEEADDRASTLERTLRARERLLERCKGFH